MAVAPGAEPHAWETLVSSLGLAKAAAGQRCSSPGGVPSFAGLVEVVSEAPQHHAMILRLEQPGPGVASLGAFVCDGPAMVTMTFYLYGARAAAAAAEHQPAWEKWMSEKFPAVAQPATP